MKNAAFTLIEILIVVILLGILAAIVVPQFSESQDDANNSKVRQDLQTLRTQVQLYLFKEGALPTSLNDLTQATVNQPGGYIQSEPTQPDGTAYTYAAGVVSASGYAGF